MTLQEIEKLRQIYTELNRLWATPALMQYSGQPLQSLSEIIEQAVWDRHNDSVQNNGLRPRTIDYQGATVEEIESYYNEGQSDHTRNGNNPRFSRRFSAMH